jgi:hypothetical protein
MYRHGWGVFRTFLLQQQGHASLHHMSSDAREALFCLFVTHCFTNLKVACVTIKTYLAAVRYFCVCDTPSYDPFVHPTGQLMLKLQYTLKGIKKCHVNHSTACARVPVTIPILHALLHVLDKGVFGHYIDTMLKCVFLVAFFAFLRCGEYTSPTLQFNPQVGLTRQDVWPQQQPGASTAFCLRLKASKTDIMRKGIILLLHKTNNSLCPVSAIAAYTAIRDPLHGSPDAPFFMLPSLQPLTRGQFTYYLDSVLSILHLPISVLRPHSFRIGAATTAAAAGVPDHLLKTLGRWSSDCYQRYIHTPTSLISQAQVSMAQH